VVGTELGKFALLSLLLPLYSKIRKERVLDHFMRGQIYYHIKTNPGDHYNSIKRRFKLNNGTLVHHLRTLEREEYIKSHRDGLYRRFYPVGMKIPEAKPPPLNPTQKRIISIIAIRPGITQKGITASTGESQQTISYNIRVLEKAKIIYSEKEGKRTHYYTRLPPEEVFVQISGVCPFCGMEFKTPETPRYCPNCGRPMSPLPTA
jgi:predicted transcriptional regulator